MGIVETAPDLRLVVGKGLTPSEAGRVAACLICRDIGHHWTIEGWLSANVRQLKCLRCDLVKRQVFVGYLVEKNLYTYPAQWWKTSQEDLVRWRKAQSPRKGRSVSH
jgi:hypothetical protein